MLIATTSGFFLGLSLIVAIGAQNAFVLRQGLRRSHVFAICLTCAASDAALITAGIGGLARTITTVPWLIPLLRYGGAAYLIYVGIRLWTVKPVIAEIAEPQRRRDLFTVCLTAIALNLGNPKMPLFYLALLPNFVGADFSADAYLSLAAVIVSVEMVVVTGHVWIAGRARRLLRTPRIIKAVNRGAGTVLAGAGIAVIATHRSS